MWTLAFKIQPANAGTINVPDDYSTIQAAIDAASLGDTVFVRTGTYVENVVVNKNVSLVGENVATTIIDGGGSGTVVNITANGVQVTSFTIRNSGPKGWVNAGIRLEGASYCSIYGNNITANTGYGIWLSYSSDYNNIYGNNITANDLDGIYLSFSRQNNIYENEIKNNRYGVGLSSSSNYNSISGNIMTGNGRGFFVSSSNYNNISGNTITNSVDGIRLEGSSSNSINRNNITANDLDGIGLYIYSDANSIYENEIKNNSYGIRLSSSNNVYKNTITNSECGISIGGSSNNVYENTITNSVDGIRLEGPNNRIYGNDVLANTGYGIYLSFSHQNNIYHNNFANNTNQVYLHNSFENVWDDGYPSGGNYWSDYNGTDHNGDGIGDTPYTIDNNNQDRYPLVNRWVIPEFPVSVMFAGLLTLITTFLICAKKTARKHMAR